MYNLKLKVQKPITIFINNNHNHRDLQKIIFLLRFITRKDTMLFNNSTLTIYFIIVKFFNIS
jgi:hypothetical protein